MFKLDVRKILFLVGAVIVISFGIAQATPVQMKAYKEAFPGSKPKCASCHDMNKPVKPGDRLGLNDYGMAIMKDIEKVPDVETYKKAGKIEDFKKE